MIDETRYSALSRLPTWICSHCNESFVGWKAVADHRDNNGLKNGDFYKSN